MRNFRVAPETRNPPPGWTCRSVRGSLLSLGLTVATSNSVELAEVCDCALADVQRSSPTAATRIFMRKNRYRRVTRCSLLCPQRRRRVDPRSARDRRSAAIATIRRFFAATPSQNRMNPMSTTSLITFAEFELLPEIQGKRELVDGEITVMPPPDLAHSRVAKQILLLFLARLDKNRVWPDHTGYRIADGWIEPDVSVSWLEQAHDERYFRGSPMIAVEVLSSGEEIDRKLTLYFAEGALEVWVVDLKHRAMTVYARHADQVIRHAVDREYRSDAAQATFSLAEIFS